MHKLLTINQFEKFAKVIEDYSGFHLEPNRLDDLSIVINNRLTVIKLDIDKYFELLKKGAEEELKQVVGLLTVNETSFLRYPEQFSLLQKVVIPKIIESGEKRDINIWSAGCSTGEEPYSLAIVLSELLPGYTVRILATDIDKGALEKAKKGIYNQRTLRLMSLERLNSYFTPKGNDLYELRKSIKNKVIFMQHNIAKLKSPGGFTNFDIIFCRNVLIYFNKETYAKIIGSYYEMLNDNGYLFLGHSESLYSICTEFKTIGSNNAYVYQKLSQPLCTTITRNHKDCCEWKPVDQSKIQKQKIEIPVIKPIVLEKDTSSSDAVYFKSALDLYLNKKPEVALEVIDKILNPKMKESLLKAQILIELNRINEAKKICNNLILKYKFNSHLYFILGIAAIKENNRKEAFDNFRKAAYTDDVFGLSHFFLANIYRRDKNEKRANFEYRKCLQILDKAPSNDLWTILSPQFSPKSIAKTCSDVLSKSKS